MRAILVSVIVLVLLASAFWAVDCFAPGNNCTSMGNTPAQNPVVVGSSTKGGYVEQVTVRVLDEKVRAVPGALVNITWDVSQGLGPATTKTVATGDNGRASFTLTNVEFAASDTNYTYIVRVGYGSAHSEKPFTASTGSVEQTFVLPVYRVVFRVHDGHYRPLAGVAINVDGKFSTKTSSDGVAQLVLDGGKHVASPQYGDVDLKIPFTVKDDMSVDIPVSLYNLNVRVMDDNGNPLGAQVNVGGQALHSGPDGWANFTNITSQQETVEATYGRYRKSLLVNLSQTSNALMIFDSTPPVIKGVFAQYKDNNLQVRAQISDPGQYASGMSNDNASIELFYIGPDNVQRELPMYSVGYGLYEGLIPISSGQSVVRYTIQATDASGNSASNSDTYVVQAAAPSGFNQTNEPPPATVMEDQFRLDWTIYPLLFVVALAAAAGGYWYYKTRRPPTEEEPPVKPSKTQEYAYGGIPMDAVPKKGGPPKPPSLPK